MQLYDVYSVMCTPLVTLFLHYEIHNYIINLVLTTLLYHCQANKANLNL